MGKTMGKDRKVQPAGRKAEDALRPYAEYALFGVIAAMGIGGLWNIWKLVMETGYPNSIRIFAFLVACLAANGVLAWIITRSWEKEAGVRSSS